MSRSRNHQNFVPPPSPDDVLVTGRSILELIHAAEAALRGEARPQAAPGIHGRRQSGRVGGPPPPSGETAAGDRAATDAAAEAMTPHAVRAAIYLYQHGEQAVGELARGLGVSIGWASRVVEELEAAGLAERRRDRADRRIAWIRLTDESRARVEAEYRWRGDAVERALATYSPEERRIINGFIRSLTDELLAETRHKG